jgi:alkanesulfonate monooxygenase SsuD/methylene tetrahydromethanopterin reductase-like flavin-dependent oxidoreductase (luciferase family)
MEFFATYVTSVPKAVRERDPDAEHKAIMNDLGYMVAAEKAGFKYLCAPEHHFLDEYSHTAGNFPAFGYLAAKTERAHLISGIINPLPQVIHPARVAETVAMLDHITDGRFEFGTGRGAGSHEILAFLPDVTDLDETKAIWEDVIGEFPKMWLQDPYEGYESQYWQLPERRILPRMYKPAHPPMWYAAGNPTSFEMAGRKGLGVLGFAIQSLKQAERVVPSYKKGIAEAEPVGAFVNDYLTAFMVPFVSEDEEQAIEWAMSDQVAFYTSMLFRYHDTFPRPADIPAWPDLAPTPTRDDVAHLQRAGRLIGTPDQVIETLKRYEALGIDGIGLSLGILGEEHAQATLECFAKYIIPALDTDPEFRTDRFRYGAPLTR